MQHWIRIAALLSTALVARAQTTLVSADAQGNHGNGDSGRASITADGRFIAFTSNATNLVPPDNNGGPDIFVKDMLTRAIVRASVSSAEVEADSYSLYPAIASGGRFVVFYSHADNLVPGDVNGAGDIFLRDLSLGLTELVSVDSSGNQGNNASRGVAISADGRFVAFASGADNLVAGDTNGASDIFLRDRQLGTTSLVSVAWDGAPGSWTSSAPSISDDGRFVVFASQATNLIPGDLNGKEDVFVRDLSLGTIECVSVSTAGIQGDGPSGFVHTTGYHFTSVSQDGRFVVFPSYATNLVPGDTNGVADVFLHDRWNGTTLRASVSSNGTQASDHCTYPVVFGNGRYVAFASAAPELAAGDVNGIDDVFVHDFVSGLTTLMSIDSSGFRGDLYSSYPVVSADGKTLAYESSATNLVPQDTNDALDTFVTPLLPTTAPLVYCSAQSNSLGCVPSISSLGTPSLSSTATFLISASGVLNHKPGLLLYGFSAASTPFLGGTLCIAPPIARAGGANSGGTAPPATDCSGRLRVDFNARIHSHAGGLALGAEVFAQFWSRDPLAPGHVNLSDALRFVLAP